MVIKCMNWIHPQQRALLRMCHFDDMLDPSGIICAFLILCCLMGGHFDTRTPSDGNDGVISYSNVGMDSWVMTFFLHSTVKCDV